MAARSPSAVSTASRGQRGAQLILTRRAPCAYPPVYAKAAQWKGSMKRFIAWSKSAV